jgi:hypothetical protein
VAPVSEQPQAEETSRASSLLPLCFRSASALLPLCFRSASALLPLCFRSASALLPPCFHPLPHRLLVLVPQLEADFALFEQVGAAVSAAARQARRAI